MRLYNPLNVILNNEIKIKLLRFLSRTSGEWSGRRLAKEINVSPAACHKALSELQKEGVLQLKKIGRTYLYSLNQNNILVKNLLKPLYKKEQMIPLTLANIIRKMPPYVKKRVVSLGIFGSISRRKEHPSSDIDLLVIVKEKKDKRLLEETLEKFNVVITRRYGNILSPYIQTVQEIRSKFKKRLPLIRNIIHEHRLIFGKPLISVIHGCKKNQK